MSKSKKPRRQVPTARPAQPLDIRPKRAPNSRPGAAVTNHVPPKGRLDAAAPTSAPRPPAQPVVVLTVEDLIAELPTELPAAPVPVADGKPAAEPARSSAQADRGKTPGATREIPGRRVGVLARWQRRRQRRLSQPAPWVPPHQRISRRRRRREYRQLGFVELAPAALTRRHRILPRTVIGISVAAMFFGLGAGLSAVALYSHYRFELKAVEERTDTMFAGMEGTYRESVEQVRVARTQALSDIALTLAASRIADSTWTAGDRMLVAVEAEGNSTTFLTTADGLVTGETIEMKNAGASVSAVVTAVDGGLAELTVAEALFPSGLGEVAPGGVVFAARDGVSYMIAIAGPPALWSVEPNTAPPTSVESQPLFSPTGLLVGFVADDGVTIVPARR